MPRILELRDIDGEVWARVGKPAGFPTGIALWTPDEQTRLWNDAIEAAAELADIPEEDEHQRPSYVPPIWETVFRVRRNAKKRYAAAIRKLRRK